jgi:hypothetical protein
MVNGATYVTASPGCGIQEVSTMMNVLAFALAGSLYAPTPCESLKTIALSDLAVTVAEMVPAGPYTAPAPGGAPPAPEGRSPRRVPPAVVEAEGRRRLRRPSCSPRIAAWRRC